MAKLFFLVSGEHETLPFAEVKAILESEGMRFTEVKTFTRVICLNSSVRGVFRVADRSSMCKVCGLELFRCEADREEVQRRIREVPYGDYVKRGQSFSVRLKSVSRSSVNSLEFEREIGGVISGIVKGVEVNLVNPDVSFMGLLTDSIMIFGVKLAEVSAKSLYQRMPMKRPFNHPSTMPPKLARCMVNLARVKPGSLLLDPFCGVGSILLEAGDMRCKVYGSDVNKMMVKGSSINLRYFCIPFEGMIVGDARKLALKAVDSIVSDPPYGRSSPLIGVSIDELVLDFLVEAMGLLPSGGYVSLSLPSTFSWRSLAKDAGYGLVELHFYREHKSLTREILILKKP